MNIKKLIITTAMAVCMAAPAFTIVAPAFAEATPKTESVITHDQITLGDVFDGVTEDVDHYLAPAPELGKTITLGTYDLQRISDAFKLGWKPNGNDAHVVIRRSSDEIDSMDIESALEKNLQEKMKGQKFETELSDRSIGLHVPLNGGQEINRAVIVGKLTYDAANGTFHAVVAAAAAPDTKQEVSGYYYPINQIPVLKTPLRPGDVISADDIDYIDMRSTDITSSMVTEAANLIGQTPRRGVSAMKPLTSSDVKLPTIVKKGDLVTMVLKNNALSLTAQGRALDNGAAGDAIHVMNSSSKQVLDAIVTGSQTVSVRPPLGTL